MQEAFRRIDARTRDVERRISEVRWYHFGRRLKLEARLELLRGTRRLLQLDQQNIDNHNWNVFRPEIAAIYQTEFNPQNREHVDLIEQSVPSID